MQHYTFKASDHTQVDALIRVIEGAQKSYSVSRHGTETGLAVAVSVALEPDQMRALLRSVGDGTMADTLQLKGL